MAPPKRKQGTQGARSRARRSRTRPAPSTAAMHAVAGAALLAFLVWPGPGAALLPLVTDDTGTQGQGKHQVEVATELSRDEEKARGVRTRADVAGNTLGFAAGVHDDVDVAVGTSLAWTRVRQTGAPTAEETGLGDTSLSVKWRFFRNGGLSLALKPGLLLPTGDAKRGFGNGRVGYQGLFVATHEFGPLVLSLNGGYERLDYSQASDRAASRRDLWRASAAGVYELSRSLHVAADLGASANPDKSSNTPPVYGLLALVHAPSESVDLSLGAKVGLTKPETDLGLLFGLTWRP